MRRFLDATGGGVFLLAMLVLVESIQLIIVLGLISSFIPVKIGTFSADLFPMYKAALQPNRQMLIYHIFIGTAILAQILGMYALGSKIAEGAFQRGIKSLLCVDSLWVFIQCFALFKILVYGFPSWAWTLFYTSLAGSLLSRIFWSELTDGASHAQRWLVSSTAVRQTKDVSASKTRDEWGWIPLFVVVASLQLVMGFNWCWGQTKAPLFSYGVFILGIVLFSFLVRKKKILSAQTKAFITAETVITTLLLCALFKMTIYDYRNHLAKSAYQVLLVLAILNKIGWPLLSTAARSSYKYLILDCPLRHLRMGGDMLVAGLIGVVLYLPDPTGVLAKMFAGEQVYHVNSFVMAPAWAYVSGALPYVDVISHYGLGLPIVLSTLTKGLGGFNYLNMLLVFMWICIIYFVLCYAFLRLWLKSFALATAAILWAIKAQMFFTLTLPQPLTYPNGTPIRFMFDILFLFSIWGHLCRRSWIYLWLAAFNCALSLFYMMETGLYLTLTFYGYLLISRFTPSMRREMFSTGRQRAGVLLCALSVPVWALVLATLAVGRHVMEPAFWANMLEPAQYITIGLNMGPFYGGLQYGQFLDLLIGFLFPIVFIVTILIIVTLCILGKISRKHLMVVVLCLYGLGAHHYYVAMATANNYYTRALPFIFVIFYWIRIGLAGLSRQMRLRISTALMAFCAYALFTNHHYLSYPNLLSFSRNPLVDPQVAEDLPTRESYFFHKAGWEGPENLKLPFNSLGSKDEGIKTGFGSDQELKAYYNSENNYAQDASLIQSLTSAHQPVALISSFEIEILMQANRRPLFYYFHFLYSRPMRVRTFPTDEIYSTRQFQRFIDELREASSPYVFMERIFLEPKVPASYFYDRPGLMGLLSYVKSHYRPYRYGKYLVALKRIS